MKDSNINIQRSAEECNLPLNIDQTQISIPVCKTQPIIEQDKIKIKPKCSTENKTRSSKPVTETVTKVKSKSKLSTANESIKIHHQNSQVSNIKTTNATKCESDFNLSPDLKNQKKDKNGNFIKNSKLLKKINYSDSKNKLSDSKNKNIFEEKVILENKSKSESKNNKKKNHFLSDNECKNNLISSKINNVQKGSILEMNNIDPKSLIRTSSKNKETIKNNIKKSIIQNIHSKSKNSLSENNKDLK